MPGFESGGGVVSGFGTQQLLADGNVVAVYDGGVDAINPDNTTTPLKDAKDAIDASGGGQQTGVIYLPPKSIDDNMSREGNWMGKTIIGTRPSDGDDSTLKFTNHDNPPFEHTGYGDFKKMTWVDVSFDGDNLSNRQASSNADATNCFKASATNGISHWNFRGHISFSNFGDKTINITSTSGKPFDMRWDMVEFSGTAGDNFYCNDFCMIDVGYWKSNPSDGGWAINIDRAAQINIGYMNVGDTPAGAVRINAPTRTNLGLDIDQLNFEPADATNCTEAIRLATQQLCNFGVIAHKTGTLDQVVALNGGANAEIGRINSSATTNNNLVVVESDTDAPGHEYHGPMSDVTDNSGTTLTGPIYCWDGDVT